MKKNQVFKMLLSLILIVSMFGGFTSGKASAAQSFTKPATGTYTSGFGWRTMDGVTSFHYGQDIANNNTNSPITASAAGTVIKSETHSSYGEWILVRHSIGGKTYETAYAHMITGSRKVGVGSTVAQGQLLGYMGSTGNSTGQHLHFELHVGTWNGSRTNAVDPIPYLNGTINVAPTYHEYDGTYASLRTKSLTGGSTINLYGNPGYGIIGTLDVGDQFKVYSRALGSDQKYYYAVGGGYVHQDNGTVTQYTGSVKSGTTVYVYDAPNGNVKQAISAGSTYTLIGARDGWYAIDSTNWFKATDLNVTK
ncbi:M23 family metallopeptidase [Paenisporosarcina sp. OV554]|uniref:M23 family metallopeptidase n=1 Tax=Paenisporosarcina sp. OV554 TaxID=2135694 RepID=UPI000D35EC8E|nr:M23 family metallopeptidase [Paenisporosarcina sp. OV554]PUB12640.1 peptidase M23-like protein [Paenisporosarcina sp. OV554]